MPKKGGNQQNLIPIQASATSEQRKIRSDGGKARAKKQAEKKTLQEELLAMLATVEDGETDTINTRITTAIIKKALAGDVKAFEVIRDTIGQKPKEEFDVTAKFNGGGLTQTLEALKRKD